MYSDLKHNKNGGFTLIELLVALAVSAIVLSAVIALVTTGTRQYRNQTTMSKVQEDANITLNQISDSVMEAVCVSVSNSETETGNTTFFKVNDSLSYIYNTDNDILYVRTKVEGSETDSVLCENVKRFRVQIMDSSVEKDISVDVNGNTVVNSIIAINNPVQVKVSIEVCKDDYERNISRTTGVRNKIDTLTLQGFDVMKFPVSDVLNKYGFLTE